MTAERIGIVWNPSKVSERELRSEWEAAASRVPGPAPEVLWFETSAEDAGLSATAEAVTRGCDVVVAAGGDGTIRAVAEALGDSGSPAAELGVAPLGTGNLLARNVGIPIGNPRAAFARVLTQHATPLDLGRVRFRRADGTEQQHGFVVMVGFGIDAQMIIETDDDLKARAGWLAYVESLGRAAASAEVVKFAMTLDDQETVTEEAHTVLIANCGDIQGGITLVPDATPDDGELDLLVLRANDAAAWLDTMRNFVWQNGLKRMITRADTAESTESTDHLRATKVSFELPTPTVFEIDGDEVGEVTAFTVEVLPGALRLR
ncbi:diacylglycerol/lipid kinase family protein [Leucobacter sp. USHLN153]|uniref:diacylglycerol/lipid kinase family protein n=1 Tax=Leucobacter sp. USHLN153 TaxID=3081268 RepID=UPI0030160CD6